MLFRMNRISTIDFTGGVDSPSLSSSILEGRRVSSYSDFSLLAPPAWEVLGVAKAPLSGSFEVF